MSVSANLLRRFAAGLLCGAWLGLPTLAAAQISTVECGSLVNAYGPYDYRVYKDSIEIQRVDQHHFTPLVEGLIKPIARHFGGDMDYTLRASPNHHRALITMARWSERLKNPTPPDASYTVDCYFDRAMRFAQDDLVVRMIYAGHLGRTGRKADALAQLDHVAAKADNAFTHYNAGLAYFDLQEFDKALKQAHAAARLGMPRTELRERLKAQGKWVELPAAPSPGVAANTAPPKP
ncbi:MAG: ABC transporter permease [Rubrivivax sp.]|nr:ABC transporter permease [Rubrivivax sp.]